MGPTIFDINFGTPSHFCNCQRKFLEKTLPPPPLPPPPLYNADFPTQDQIARRQHCLREVGGHFNPGYGENDWSKLNSGTIGRIYGNIPKIFSRIVV